jgi:hypothetical protein
MIYIWLVQCDYPLSLSEFYKSFTNRSLSELVYDLPKNQVMGMKRKTPKRNPMRWGGRLTLSTTPSGQIMLLFATQFSVNGTQWITGRSNWKRHKEIQLSILNFHAAREWHFADRQAYLARLQRCQNVSCSLAFEDEGENRQKWQRLTEPFHCCKIPHRLDNLVSIHPRERVSVLNEWKRIEENTFPHQLSIFPSLRKIIDSDVT